MSFQVGPILERDSIFVLELGLSQVRLMNNANFPWIILVPKVIDAVEITDLSPDEYNMVNAEIKLMAKVMQVVFEPDKLNIATIGNKVKQLHYHIIARFEKDSCFPETVWGRAAQTYDDKQLNEIVDKIQDILGHKE